MKSFPKVLPKVFPKVLKKTGSAVGVLGIGIPLFPEEGSPLEDHPSWSLYGGDDPSHMGWKSYGLIITVEPVAVNQGSLLAYRNFDATDAKCQATLITPAPGGEDGNYTSICIRGIDVDNWIGVRDRIGLWEVVERVGGSYTTIFSGGPAPAPGDVFSMSIVQDTVTVTVNDTEIFSGTSNLPIESGGAGFFEHSRTYAGDYVQGVTFTDLAQPLYSPMESHPDWELMEGSEDSPTIYDPVAKSIEITSTIGAGGYFPIMYTGGGLVEDMSASFIITFEGDLPTYASFILARWQDFDNFVGVTIHDGQIMVYEHWQGLWADLDVKTPVAGTTGQRVEMNILRNQVELIVDGVTIGAKMTRVSGAGYMGVILQEHPVVGMFCEDLTFNGTEVGVTYNGELVTYNGEPVTYYA